MDPPAAPPEARRPQIGAGRGPPAGGISAWKYVLYKEIERM